MINKEYIIGLVDGEGSFNIQINTNNRRRAKIDLRFSLKLRYQDKEILDELKKFFKCGNVYIQRDKRKNHSLCYRFEVCDKKDIIEKIIPFFIENQPKIPSRMRDFEIFKQIAELSQQDSLDLEKIKFLKNQMHWGLAVYGKTVRAVGTLSSS
jgi:hypothetical protein